MDHRKTRAKLAQGYGEIRSSVPRPPRGWERLKWYGPGLLWLVATVGSGQVLFTPRIGSRYGFELLWAALLILIMMWVVLREIGRYTVVTGKTILTGYRNLPGPPGWAVWLFFCRRW
ncbi:MAG: Nramp family divalent metal transporter [Dehalococcoidales bacterium]|nr:Nramp family divalent metal transporter [Dehalococcoidales bacterium]